MTPSETIVAYDGSPDAEAALVWAVQHATENRGPLTLLHVADGVTVLPDEPLTLDDPETATTALESRASRIRKSVPGLEVTSLVVEGDVLRSLLSRSAPEVLIAVGSGSGGVLHLPGRWSLGARLTAHAAGPVAIIPTIAAEGGVGVLVGIDGGAQSEHLVHVAAQVALAAAQPLRVVHAWLPPVMWLNRWPLDAETLTVVETPHRQFLDDAVAHVRQAFPGLAVDGTLIKNHAAIALLSATPPPLLIVVGKRSRSAFQSALLGSTGLSILLDLSAPCLVVPDAAVTGSRPATAEV